MSLLGTLLTGGSGLQANQKWAEVTGRNIANANTPGYHRQEVQFGSWPTALGGGTYVSSVSRSLDSSLVRMHRFEASKFYQQDAVAKGLQEYTALLGQPDDARSPAARLSEFKEALLRLENNPASAAIQRGVVSAADALAYSLRETSAALEAARQENELAIGQEIDRINRDLLRLAELNADIQTAGRMNADSLELLDERDRILDRLSQSMNIRTAEYDDGRVILYTGGGTKLVEGATTFPLRYDSGTGRIRAGDVDITPEPTNPRAFDHGRLAGLLQLKNEVLPQFGLQLDELARSLIVAFETADDSLGPGQAGLFTDSGQAYSAADLKGLAGRIAVNDAVKPEKGGQLWRVREGVAATLQQGASRLDQVQRFTAVFGEVMAFDGGTGFNDLTLEDFATHIVSFQGVTRADAERGAASTAVAVETLQNARVSMSGVSIDDELQKMMLIEQSYAANAQLIRTAASMLDELMSIV